MPIHGASTEVEFACKMSAFVYTIDAMMPVMPGIKQRGRGGARWLERLLLELGEDLVRVPPKLMAPERRAGRARGKSDPIDALAVARAGPLMSRPVKTRTVDARLSQ
jgi:hypothetical protein